MLSILKISIKSILISNVSNLPFSKQKYFKVKLNYVCFTEI